MYIAKYQRGPSEYNSMLLRGDLDQILDALSILNDSRLLVTHYASKPFTCHSTGSKKIQDKPNPLT